MIRATPAIAVAAALACSEPAAAQELPRWKLRVTCAAETDPACRALEANAYSHLSGEWRSLATRVKTACLADAESFGHASYRLLRLCLDAASAERLEVEEDPAGAVSPSGGQRP